MAAALAPYCKKGADQPTVVTPLYSLRENAIAKEPGLSYPE